MATVFSPLSPPPLTPPSTVWDAAPPTRVGPNDNGRQMTLEEFESVSYEDSDPHFRYELFNGVLVVTPSPSIGERDPNDELGYLIRKFQREHPNGGMIDLTVAEQDLKTSIGVRRADRAIWCGLGRKPVLLVDIPTIVVEFVSERSRDRKRDYETKVKEYLAMGVREYWIVDRFRRSVVACTSASESRVLLPKDILTTPFIPGFELPLAPLFAITDQWTAKPC